MVTEQDRVIADGMTRGFPCAVVESCSEGIDEFGPTLVPVLDPQSIEVFKRLSISECAVTGAIALVLCDESNTPKRILYVEPRTAAKLGPDMGKRAQAILDSGWVPGSVRP